MKIIVSIFSMSLSSSNHITIHTDANIIIKRRWADIANGPRFKRKRIPINVKKGSKRISAFSKLNTLKKDKYINIINDIGIMDKQTAKSIFAFCLVTKSSVS